MTKTITTKIAAHRKVRTLKVQMDPSSFRWLRALAKANGATPSELLQQAAFCMADYAGRRCGSWEASVGGQMLISSGWQKEVHYLAQEQCWMQDRLENQFQPMVPPPTTPEAA